MKDKIVQYIYTGWIKNLCVPLLISQ